MFDWLRKRRYRNEIMVNVLSLTVMLEDGATDLIYSLLPGLRDHIDDKYAEGADPYHLAVDVAAIVLTETMEHIDPAVRERCAEQITRLINEEEIEDDLEPFVSKFVIMHKVAKSWERQGLIELSDRDRLEHEVYGGLLGLDREERSKNRLQRALSTLVTE